MEKDLHALFTDYLENSLSDSDRISFEERLAREPEFLAEFEGFKEIYRVLQNQFSPQRAAVLESIKKADENYIFNQPSKKKPGRVISLKPWQIGVAASILFLIGLFVYNGMQKPLYSEYAPNEEIVLTLRSDSDVLAKKAETAYNAGKYKEALQYLDALLKTDPENSELQYYKARALVETDGFAAAEDLLIPLSHGNSAFAHKAIYLRALSQIKQKKYMEAKKILKTIPSSSPEYKNAQKLLSKL